MHHVIHKCRRIVIAVVAFCVIATVLWWALWSVAAGQYRNVLDGWIESGRASGYQITYADRQTFGFPRRVIIRFTNVHWRNTDGIDFHTGQIDVGAIPWQWQKFYAKYKGNAEIEAPLEADRSLVIGGEKGSAVVVLDNDGFWKFSRLILNDAHVGRAPDYIFHADRLEATAERPDETPKTHKETGLTVSGNADNITTPAAMPTPFGNKVNSFAINFRVMDAVPDFRIRKSVDAWNKDSGVVEIDRLHLDWGTLLLNAKGTLGFDDDLQPEGAFAGAVGRQSEVMRALNEGGFIPMRQQEMLAAAMELFGKPSKFTESTDMALPITVQLGGLFLGPVKIFTFPEVVWPEDVPRATVNLQAPAPTPAPAAAPVAVGTSAPAVDVGTASPIGTTAPVGTAVPIGTNAAPVNLGTVSPPAGAQP